jgi:hydrogenase/urease accessory protein HupE
MNGKTMSLLSRIFFQFCFLLMIIGLMGSTALAHFTTDSGARLIHITKTENAANEQGILVYLRIPAPLVYGSFLTTQHNNKGQSLPPFLSRKIIDGRPYFQLDQHAARNRSSALADFLAEGYAFTIDDKAVIAQPKRAAFFSQADHPDFITPSGASRALDDFVARPTIQLSDTIYIVDALFDVEIFLPTNRPDSALSIQSVLPKINLPSQIIINNAVMDHRFDPPFTKQFPGQMLDPLRLDGSWLSSLASFIWQGIWHIFIGLDHVLFVVCLALASGISASILWSVTGFTLGHSVTLFLGYFGFSPQGDWFIPAIETAIAISILYAAFLVLKSTFSDRNNNKTIKRNLFLAAAFIGLIHGYGFSFVLGDLLGDGVNQLWLALIGFNAGVELGQITIVLAVFALLWPLQKLGPTWPKSLKYLGVVVAGSFAILWTIERTQSLMAIYL